MDVLRLKGLEFFGRHGTELWEKETGCRFRIDLELGADFSQAARTDRLADALDYRVIFSRARHVVEEETHNLVETVAHRLLHEMFHNFDLESVKVNVAKVEARIGGLNQAVEIEIERTRDEVKVILYTARPGVIIGRKGQEVERLQGELQDLVGRRINIKIEEISRPEIYAQLVAEDIAEQLQKRSSFRRTMKRAMEQTMEAGAKGIKIQLAGRLGGAEMARREKQIAGSIPLSSFKTWIPGYVLVFVLEAEDDDDDDDDDDSDSDSD